MMDNHERYPLHWPVDWPRTRHRRRARYEVSFAKAKDDLYHELRLMGAKNVILSTNIPIRKDGDPRAGEVDKKYEDPGCAVYFERNGKRIAVACDTWTTVRDNLRAIGLTIAGIRSIQRAGASELLDRAFMGFKALPAPGEQQSWWGILGCSPDASLEVIQRCYREAASKAHPDHGGSDGRMQEINRAYAEAKAARSHAA